MKKLPIGIQSIEKILGKDAYIYIDKTHFAQQLIEGDAQHYFLSRPRRFGKSLFLDTLKEILRGNKELFKDCHIYQADYDWQPYTVLTFNFRDPDNATPEALEVGLRSIIDDIAEVHAIELKQPTLRLRLKALVRKLAAQQPRCRSRR